MNETVQRWRHRAAHHAVTWLSTRPALYYGIRRAIHRSDSLCVNRSTQLVIEGFPRSANSTTVYGFKALQDRPVTVAHHKHHAAQILRAAHWGIPAVVLVRQPADAIVSLLALAEEGRLRTGRTGRGNALTLLDAMQAWFCFYKSILPIRDKYIVARFEDVIRDLPGMITGINMRYGTSFRTAPLPRLEEQTGLGWHAVPNEVRSAIINELRNRLKEESSRGRLHDMLARCSDVYRALATLQ